MLKSTVQVCVIGMGLAGSECAYQLLTRGIAVTLIDMRPKKLSPAHHTDQAAELVCSNSLRSSDVGNAVGLLKEEMANLNSVVIRSAYQSRVPAGSALAVDREEFSKRISEQLHSFDHFTKIEDVVVGFTKTVDGSITVQLENLPELLCQYCIVATGPLTEDQLAQWILKQTDRQSLYFYDSIAPIVNRDSIDMSKAFKQSRYDKDQSDDGDYINCPMNKEEYERFIDSIIAAELAPVHDFDKAQFFEGCLPIEEMVRRGRETLLFGPLKPVGLTNPNQPDQRLHAVVQLRQDNLHASLYNMVGFQTRLKWGEQTRIFRMIPGLENAEFFRMGSMHRNTYICSPELLGDGLELKSFPGLFFAGQITGCEGYVESAAVGLFVGLNLAARLKTGENLTAPPSTTAFGALIRHILKADPEHYQPMNINWGLFDDLEVRARKFDKKVAQLKRAVFDFRCWIYDKLSEI